MRAAQWNDYELIDTGDGERLERWGDILLIRLQGKDKGKAAGGLYGPQVGGMEENVVGFRVMRGGNSNNGSFRFHKGFLLVQTPGFTNIMSSGNCSMDLAQSSA